VGEFGAFLGGRDGDGGDPLVDPHARDFAARDFKAHLKTVARRSPRSVNLALAAVDSFYRQLGLGSPQVARERLPTQAPRALEGEEVKRLLRAVERCDSARDRALVGLLFYTALRVGEAAALDVEDVAMTARRGRVVVRSGKGDAYREVPLNAPARTVLEPWWRARRRALAAREEERALFTNRGGGRLSARSMESVVGRVGGEAGLALTPHVLRHTCVTLLVRAGHDLVLVAELAGHRRLETTRRYSLPSAADRAAAMDTLTIEH
jgi:site-specific recombinase XerD